MKLTYRKRKQKKMLKIKENEKKTTVNPWNMKKGAIGVIVSWGLFGKYLGDIVMKFDNYCLVSLITGDHWSDINCFMDNTKEGEYLIELLPNGTLLEVEQPE